MVLTFKHDGVDVKFVRNGSPDNFSKSFSKVIKAIRETADWKKVERCMMRNQNRSYSALMAKRR